MRVGTPVPVSTLKPFEPKLLELSERTPQRKTVTFFGPETVLKELRNSDNSYKIKQVKELLLPQYGFKINDYIDPENKLRLLDIAFELKDRALVNDLIDLGADVSQCRESFHPSWLESEVRSVWNALHRSEKDRIDDYQTQLEASIRSSANNREQFKLDHGQAFAPIIKKLMAAYAEQLALLSEKDRRESIKQEIKTWKDSRLSFNRSFVIALGNELIGLHLRPERQENEFKSQYNHRVKLRPVYADIITAIAPFLKTVHRAELKEWVQNYNIF